MVVYEESLVLLVGDCACCAPLVPLRPNVTARENLRSISTTDKVLDISFVCLLCSLPALSLITACEKNLNSILNVRWSLQRRTLAFQVTRHSKINLQLSPLPSFWSCCCELYRDWQVVHTTTGLVLMIDYSYKREWKPMTVLYSTTHDPTALLTTPPDFHFWLPLAAGGSKRCPTESPFSE